uniref:FeS cluster biogenesis domain-containing protein n=1 Tax=Vannella robusta TaxID=1487602 RepID=A0A7S4MMB7_9EUKA
MLRRAGLFSCARTWKCGSFLANQNFSFRYYSQQQMPLDITEACAKALEARSKGGTRFLRIGLTRGCHGYMYEYKMSDNLNETDLVFGEGNAKVVVEKDDYEKMEGATIDYSEAMERNGFAVTKNPKAMSSCGCDRSFTPDSFNALFESK